MARARVNGAAHSRTDDPDNGVNSRSGAESPTPPVVVHPPAVFASAPLPPVVMPMVLDNNSPHSRPHDPSPLTQASTAPSDLEHRHDGGLSNPVGLLTEAVDEEGAPPATDGHGLNAGRDVRALPVEYTLPDTLHAMLTEGPFDSSVPRGLLETEHLCSGLETLLAESAQDTLSVADQQFFRPLRRQIKRDIGPEYDPVAQALLTPAQAKAFFGCFFSRLHPLVPVLDVEYDTVESEFKLERGHSS